MAKMFHFYSEQVDHAILTDFLLTSKLRITRSKHFNVFCGVFLLIAKFLVPLIESIKSNKFTVKNIFEFSKEICEQNSEYFMARVDVESLFTNIPMEEIIKICCNSLPKNQELLCNISKNQFQKLLRAALSNNYFLFDGIVYQQVDGVAMGSPLVLSLGFLAHYEQIWLNDSPDEFKPVYHKRHVDIYLFYFDLLTILKNLMNI